MGKSLWGHARQSLEMAGEMTLMRKSASNRHIRNGHLSVFEQNLCPLHSLPNDVLVRGGSHRLLEGTAKMIGAKLGDRCQFF